MAGILAVSTLVAAASVVTGPDVGTAPGIVAALDRAHGSAAVMVAPSDRVSVALVAAEDDTFYSNNGVDVLAMLRGLSGLLSGSDSGGSTIEIQLAHLVFPGQTRGPWGQVRRVTLALQFDARYTKAVLLSLYLDAAYYGNGFYGIRAASMGYFGIPVSRLSWSEAAMLAGLVQAPSQLDPVTHPAAARTRRAYVLQRLVDVGALSEEQADASARSSLGLANQAATGG